jgi:hypothetical protein
MKINLLTLIALTLIVFTSCKKEDDTVAIDMTLKTYSADANFRSLTVILQLNFMPNGTVKLRAFPDDKIVTLNYEVGDKMASNTTLRIYGTLDHGMYASGLEQGTKIDWKTEIGRLSYNPEIVGFQAGGYRFTSY